MNRRVLWALAVLGTATFSAGAFAQTEETIDSVTATESATITETLQPASPWTAALFTRTWMIGLDTDKKSSVIQVVIPSLTYKHRNARYSSQFRVETDHVLFATDKTGVEQDTDVFEFGDFAYTFKDSELFGKYGYGFLRVYAPSSQASRDEAMIVRVRPEIEINSADLLGPFYVAFHNQNELFPRYRAVNAGSAKGNSAYENYAYLDTGVNLPEAFKIYGTFGNAAYLTYGDTDIGPVGAWNHNAIASLSLVKGARIMDRNFEFEALIETEAPYDQLSGLFSSENGVTTAAKLDITAVF